MPHQYQGSAQPRPRARSRSGSYPTGSGSPKRQIRYKSGDQEEDAAASPITIVKNLILLSLTIVIIGGASTILLMMYVSVRPFSLTTYRRLSCACVESFVDAMSLILPNMKICLTGDSDALSPIGVSFIVCNHCMEGDWWAMLMLARCVGLRGSVKAFLQYRNHIGGTASSSGSGSGSGSSSMTMNVNASKNQRRGMPSSASAPVLNKMMPASAASTQGFMHMTRNLSQSTILQGINDHADNGNGDGKSNGNGTSNKSNHANININTHQNYNQSHNQHQSLAITFLNKLLDFPLLSSENTKNYVQDRDKLFSLLKSFASPRHEQRNQTHSHSHNYPDSQSHSQLPPVHLLLFPEGWPEHQNRKSMIARSLEYAKREGRPQLKHLLLPRTTGFYASLDSLRDASPVVYDVTMAYRGYDGQRAFSSNISFETLMKVIEGKIPNEIHVRIKRFSMGEVLSDNNWLDKQWTEKDRMLEHFARHGGFPVDNRGFCRQFEMNTKGLCVESSFMNFVKLATVFFCIPLILLFLVPLLCGIGWMYVVYKSFEMLFPGGFGRLFGFDDGGLPGAMSRDGTVGGRRRGGGRDGSVNSGSDSAVGTPFFPATPFASPTHVASWTSAPAGGTSDSNQNRR